MPKLVKIQILANEFNKRKHSIKNTR